MTDVIYQGLDANPDLSIVRNTNHGIETGTRDGSLQGWTWMLRRGDEPLVVVYGDDLEPIERYFLQAFHYPVKYPMVFGSPMALRS
jgi:hypothetical protein